MSKLNCVVPAQFGTTTGDPARIKRTHFGAADTRAPAGIEAIVSKPSWIEPGGIKTAEIDIAGIKNAGSKSAVATTKVYEPAGGGSLGDKAAAIEGTGVDFIVADLSSTREVARAAEETGSFRLAKPAGSTPSDPWPLRRRRDRKHRAIRPASWSRPLRWSSFHG